MLVVESSSNSLSSEEDTVFSDQKVGSFTLMGTNMAQFSSHCPNSIIQMSTYKRTEVSVIWTAPPPGSGCVVFRYKNHFIYFSHKRLFLEFVAEPFRPFLTSKAIPVIGAGGL
jgi:hypothetical protein